MPLKDRDYPTIKGEDAVRFLKREKENEKKLKEKSKEKIDKWRGQID